MNCLIAAQTDGTLGLSNVATLMGRLVSHFSEDENFVFDRERSIKNFLILLKQVCEAQTK